MLDRVKFPNIHSESSEANWEALSMRERRLVHLFRLMTDEDQDRVRRMSEILTTIPDGVHTDEVAV